jgi:hypothetical protein
VDHSFLEGEGGCGEAITLTMRAARGLAGGVAIVVRRTPRGAIRTHGGLIMREV